MDDLVLREGLYYKKFTDVPFSGEVTGERQGSFENGEKDGAWVYYHESGQLRAKGNYKSGKMEGAWIAYYDNGQLWQKGNYKNNNWEGAWVDYNEDGTVKTYSTGTFKNGKKISD